MPALLLLFEMKKFFDHLEEYIVAFLLFVMTSVTVVNVFFRYVLNSHIDWAMELNIIVFGWLIFFGASWAVKIGAHIGMESFVNLFSDKIKRIFATIAVTICLVYVFIIIVGSYTYVEKIYSIGILSQDIKWLPQWVPRMIMPLGYGLLMFRLGEIFCRLILGRQSNFNLLDEAKDVLKKYNFKDEVKK